MNQLSSILNINDYRELFTAYFNALSDEVPFIVAEIYLFPKKTRGITSYRFIKGRLYEKKHRFEELEDTLLEEQLIEKEFIQYLSTDLSQKRSMIKQNCYLDEGASMVQAYPLIEVSRLNASIILLFEDEIEIDASEVIELLNIKLSILFASEEIQQDKLYYQKILLNEKIYPYHVNDINDELKNYHMSAERIQKKVIKNDGKYYELTKIDEERGFLKDISNEISLKISEQVAYRDQETALNTLNKLKNFFNEKKFSIIQIKFEKAYLHDVTKKLLDNFERKHLYRDENSIFIYFTDTDKRMLNKQVKLIRDSLSTIMTFEYSLGVIRVPNDIKKEPLTLLQSITESDLDFYHKETHKAHINVLMSKKNIINKITNNSYEINFHPIVNTRNRLEGYYVSHDAELITLKDKRIELLIIQYALEKIRKTKKNVLFFLDVSDELCKTQEFDHLLKQYRSNPSFFEKVIFVFDEVQTSAEEYLIRKGASIARKSVEALFKQEKKVDFLLQNIVYRDYNREYFAFLSRLEDKGIIPIFEVSEKDELQYVIDHGVGFVYTKKAKDVLIVKN